MSVQQTKEFERNNYFYGKLLTVRDFQTEQDYMNEKRQLLNRLIHGSGIVCGLHVENADQKGVRVAPGVALDGLGREIVVGKEYTKPSIKEIEGYPVDASGPHTLYLMLEYDEQGKEPVPALNNASGCEDRSEPNRIAERFKLSFSTTPPPDEPDLRTLLYQTKVLYEDERVRVERTAPRWVNTGDVFEVAIKATILLPLSITERIRVALDEKVPAELTRLYSDDLQFVFSDAAAGTSEERRYVLRAGDTAADCKIDGLLSISVNDASNETDTPENQVTIYAEKTVAEKLAEQLFDAQRDVDWSGARKTRTGVFLATLSVNEEGLITRIAKTARTYVYNNPLLSRLLEVADESLNKMPKHNRSHAADGEDPIDVTGLEGLLKDPQWVNVYTDNAESIKARGIRFQGEGVTVVKNANNGEEADVRIDRVPHASSHQAGGDDELNVDGLKGLLADPQQVYVGTGMKAVPRKGIHFYGTGVSVGELDGYATVSIAAGAPNVSVRTGRVVFEQVSSMESRVSPPIPLPSSEPCAIVLALEHETPYGTIGSIDSAVPELVRSSSDPSIHRSPALSAVYDLNAAEFRIVLRDAYYAEGNPVDYKVRYWIIPPTSDDGDSYASASDPLSEHLILSILLARRVISLQELETMFGKTFNEVSELLKRMAEAGQAVWEGDFIYLPNDFYRK